jgi:hypothetical protein
VKTRLIAANLAVLLLAVSPGVWGATLKAPDKVKEALRILAYVQADMASKLPNKAYDRLPHENQEFQEAAPALLDALAGEPEDLKARAAALLKKAQSAAQAVADVSATHDETRITRAVGDVDAALQPLNRLFPVGLRPVAGQLGGRPMVHGAGGAADRSNGGPPPELR